MRLSFLPQLKVLGTVVILNPIDVVDGFVWLQFPAQHLFHDEPVMRHPFPSIDFDLEIALRPSTVDRTEGFGASVAFSARQG